MDYIKKNNIIIPKRDSKSHKYDNGSVLVVGGSKEFVGAVALAGLACLRSGADIVKVVAPEKVAWAINTYSPDILANKIKGRHFDESHFKIIKKLMEKFDVLLIGNGIGLDKDTKEFSKKTIKSIKKLKVIDADSLKAISVDDLSNSIITPHAKELEIFLKNSKINSIIIKKINQENNIVKKAALIKKTIENCNKKHNGNKFNSFFQRNNVILLKGKIDIIISQNEIYFNRTGNEGMTKGGTGDVLAGLCAGFLSQSKNLVQSAINGAYFNGLIGDILAKRKKGFTYLASDMVYEIKKVMSKNK